MAAELHDVRKIVCADCVPQMHYVCVRTRFIFTNSGVTCIYIEPSVSCQVREHILWQPGRTLPLTRPLKSIHP